MEHRDRSDAGRQTLTGTARLFAAEALIFPTGLVVAAILTRWLGTGGYGVYSLAAVAVAWLEWGISSLLSRATILAVRETDDWKPLATRILQLHLAAGIAGAVALALAAPLVARALAVPALTGHLRLFALDVPLFVYAQCHRNVSTGRGWYGLRARAVAARWLVRAALVVVLVGLGLSVTGAILAVIGGSLAELVVARRYDRPPLFARPSVSVRPFLSATAPLVAASVALKVLVDADLFALKGLGATTADAGIYAAARNLAHAPMVFAAAFAPLLLSTLVRLVREQDLDHARDMSRDAFRLVLVLVPFAALAAGSAEGIVRLVFGDDFAAAGPILSRLVFAGTALVLIAVASSVLVAGGRLDRPAWIAGALVPLALFGHVWAIPRHGALGAAWVTTGALVAGALLNLAAVARMWAIAPPLASVARIGLVALAAGLAAGAWVGTGGALLVRLPLLAAAVPVALLALGEFSRREIATAWRAVVPGRRKTRDRT